MADANRKEGYSREYPHLTDKRVMEVRELYRELGRADLLDRDDGSWRRSRKYPRRKRHPHVIRVTDGSGMTLEEKIAFRKKLAGW